MFSVMGPEAEGDAPLDRGWGIGEALSAFHNRFPGSFLVPAC